MKNTSSRRMLLIFLLIAIFAFSAIIAGCIDNENGSVGSGADESPPETKWEMPKFNFEGYEINFCVPVFGIEEYNSREIGSDGFNGEIINDSVFTRNLRVEEAYNITIAAVLDGDVVKTAHNTIMADDDAYDIYTPYINPSISLVQEGLFIDLNPVENLDLTNPWWDQRAVRDLAIKNKVFYCTGDISILDKECTMALFFNKDVINDYNINEDMYKLVKDGKWTLDKLFSMSSAFTFDLNGDLKMTSDDAWGINIVFNTPHSMFFGTGERISKTDANGEVSLVMMNERAVDVADMIFRIIFDETSFTRVVPGYGGYEVTRALFGDKRLLFAAVALADLNFYRDAYVDFGIIPYPKYNEEQKEYNNLISTILVAGYAIPITNRNPGRTGAILEAMAYHAQDTLKVAFYDNTLYTRRIRDEQSRDMLDIIFATRVYDIGYIFNWGGLGTLWENLYNKRSKEFVSGYTSMEPAALTAMKETMEVFK
jgi:hypothetical protein